MNLNKDASVMQEVLVKPPNGAFKCLELLSFIDADISLIKLN